MTCQRIIDISLINVDGVLERPNCITTHSNNPIGDLKAVFHSSPTRIRTWWYPLRRSSFEKIFAPDKQSSSSSTLGIGNRYRIVILLMARMSTQSLQSPFFSGTMRAGTAQGLILGRTNPCCISSSIFVYNIFASLGLIR